LLGVEDVGLLGVVVGLFDGGFSRRVLGSLGSLGGVGVFVDAGSVGASVAGGDAFVVKLAHVVVGGSFDVLHPVEGSSGVPYLVVGGGESLRRGLTYLVEVASLLSALDGGASYAVRHGPLVQASYYLRRGYDVQDDTPLRAALGYAGLDPGLVGEVVYESRLCGGGGYNVGLAILSVAERLASRASRGAVVAGVVEDTSRSRLLAVDVVWEAARDAMGGGVEGDYLDLGGRLFDAARRGYRELEELHGGLLSEECFCGDLEPPTSAAGYDSLAQAVLAAARREGRLEAALLEIPRHLAGVGDVDLIYWASYTVGSTEYTRPRKRLGAREAVVEELKSRRAELASCRGDPEDLARPLDSVGYTYMLPERPPTCRGLSGLAGATGLRACELARLVKLPPPVRVEYMETPSEAELLGLLAYLHASAELTLYKYPAPLLVADRYSRVTRAEAAAAERLAEAIASRRLPFYTWLRGWARRLELAWPHGD